jgi:hypothetical protein
LDLSPAGEGVVATAGGDATVQVYDRAAERILASLTGHSKKVHGELYGVRLYGVPCSVVTGRSGLFSVSDWRLRDTESLWSGRGTDTGRRRRGGASGLLCSTSVGLGGVLD